MKAIIKLDVPEWQIGQDVQVYFPDSMYKLGKCEAVKEREKPEKLLPCKCGCNRREHWWGTNPNRAEILICKKCGFEVAGRNEIDVHKKWNEAIKNESKNNKEKNTPSCEMVC